MLRHACHPCMHACRYTREVVRQYNALFSDMGDFMARLDPMGGPNGSKISTGEVREGRCRRVRDEGGCLLLQPVENQKSRIRVEKRRSMMTISLFLTP